MQQIHLSIFKVRRNKKISKIKRKYGINSNLAVYCLRAYAKPYIDEVEIAEYTINQQVDDILYNRLDMKKY